ncbi:uncharacterized protein TNCV_2344451 [Trichonephila clavipes]|nr:uncharacterized protein TNCV_2344451 [Trichonephila clavipes]
MNQTCFRSDEEWSETNITGNNSFQWCFLTSSQVNWTDIENCVDVLSKEMPDIKIVDNGLIDEIGRLNVHLNYNKLKQLENQHAEIDKRWVEILNHFKSQWRNGEYLGPCKVRFWAPLEPWAPRDAGVRGIPLLYQAPQDIIKEFQFERLRLQAFVAATDPAMPVGREASKAKINQKLSQIDYVHVKANKFRCRSTTTVGILERERVLGSPEDPTKAAVARFRLLTGHDCMKSHLYRIGITDPSDWNFCDSGQPMTTEHLDVFCALKSYSCIAEKY